MEAIQQLMILVGCVMIAIVFSSFTAKWGYEDTQWASDIANDYDIDYESAKKVVILNHRITRLIVLCICLAYWLIYFIAF